MIALLEIVEQFSTWSGIHLYAGKCKIAAYIHGLQSIQKKTHRDDALRARLAHVSIRGRQIGSLAQDEPIPGGYLGTTLKAYFCLNAHLHWTKHRLELICKAFS